MRRFDRCEAARARFRRERDDASRYGFEHVKERDSRLWVHLHCELRLPLARRLPDPISTPATGALMTTTHITAETMSSGDVVPGESRERDGFRMRLARSIARSADLDDSSGLGVQLAFARAKGARERKSMEIFALPPFQSLGPYGWSPWRRADEIRGTSFAGWDKLHGVASDAVPPAIAHPFELRCRTVLSDALYTPIEAEDPAATRPGPRDSR